MIIVLFVMLVVGVINPYGIEMVTLMFTSYGNPILKNLVNELGPFSPFYGFWSAIIYIMIMLIMFLYIFSKKKDSFKPQKIFC